MDTKISAFVLVSITLLIPFTGLAVAQTNTSAGSTETANVTSTPTPQAGGNVTATQVPTEAPTPTQEVNTDTPTETSTNASTSQIEDTDENASKPDDFIGCISSRCVLKVIDYNINSNGRATVELYSEVNQQVTLTEMHMGDGFQQLNQKKNVNIPEGRVEMELWVNNEFSTMGFTVANAHGIAGFKDSSGGYSFDETYSGNQMFFFGIFGFIGGVGIVSVAAYKRKMKLNSNVEREL